MTLQTLPRLQGQIRLELTKARFTPEHGLNPGFQNRRYRQTLSSVKSFCLKWNGVGTFIYIYIYMLEDCSHKDVGA